MIKKLGTLVVMGSLLMSQSLMASEKHKQKPQQNLVEECPCDHKKPSWWKEGWALTFYSGPMTSQTTHKILFEFNAQFAGSTLLALAVSKKLGSVLDNRLQFELEADLAKYVGPQHNWEFDAPVLVARWTKFPWNDTVRTTFAIGDGISFTSRLPKYEVERRGRDECARTLNYVMSELTFGVKSLPNWDFVLRYHHRSGMFGLFDGVHDASTAFAAGIKYKF